MTVRIQDGGDLLWGPYVYDGNKKGEYVSHSLGNEEFVKWKFTVVETGETWVGRMPKGECPPINTQVTIGYPAAEQLTKSEDGWILSKI